jgi:hypothetical protein
MCVIALLAFHIVHPLLTFHTVHPLLTRHTVHPSKKHIYLDARNNSNAYARNPRCTQNVTLIANFAFTADMPCTALFELTFGSIITHLPELEHCPKVFVFDGYHEPLHNRQYHEFVRNVGLLGISNLVMLKLHKKVGLLESFQHGLALVNSPLVLVWQPDLMLFQRPQDWARIRQKLLDDDSAVTRSAIRMRDVHFQFHERDDDEMHHTPLNFSDFNAYGGAYCDQLHLATVSFYKDFIFPKIYSAKIPPSGDLGVWGPGGPFMEGYGAEYINHTSVSYYPTNGRCLKIHCNADKSRKGGYWMYWLYWHPLALWNDIKDAGRDNRDCRQFNMQSCLPWAPKWFAPRALGCNHLEHLALRGHYYLTASCVFYCSLGFLAICMCWKSTSLAQLPQALRYTCVAAAFVLPWACVMFVAEYAEGNICLLRPHVGFRCRS